MGEEQQIVIKTSVHMASATFEDKTLCGIFVGKGRGRDIVPNPAGKEKVTCGNCLRLINTSQKRIAE